MKKKDMPKPSNASLEVKDVAARLSVSISSTRRMLIEGTMPCFCVRTGRRKKSSRVRPEVLERWIESQERQSVKTRSRPALAIAPAANEKSE
jgi:hypothetical protein